MKNYFYSGSSVMQKHPSACLTEKTIGKLE